MSVEKVWNNLKYIDNKYKSLVFGFVRRSETELLKVHDNDIFYTVPELITITCLLFYNIGDIFGKVSKDLVQSGVQNNTITGLKGIPWRSAFGNIWIDSMSKDILSWNIKFNKLGSIFLIAIGLISNKHHQDAERDFDSGPSCRVYLNGATQWSRDDQIFKGIKSVLKYGSFENKFATGDTMTIVLNMENATLSYYKNEDEPEQIYPIFKNIKIGDGIQYKFALSLYEDDNKVTVTFQHRK